MTELSEEAMLEYVIAQHPITEADIENNQRRLFDTEHRSRRYDELVESFDPNAVYAQYFCDGIIEWERVHAQRETTKCLYVKTSAYNDERRLRKSQLIANGKNGESTRHSDEPCRDFFLGRYCFSKVMNCRDESDEEYRRVRENEQLLQQGIQPGFAFAHERLRALKSAYDWSKEGF